MARVEEGSSIDTYPDGAGSKPKRYVWITVLSNRSIIGRKAWHPAMDINGRLFDIS